MKNSPPTCWGVIYGCQGVVMWSLRCSEQLLDVYCMKSVHRDILVCRYGLIKLYMFTFYE